MRFYPSQFNPLTFMLLFMQREIEWIIEALARDPKKTRTGLAHVLGIDKSGVSKMLKGGRRLKYEEALRAAEYLGVSPGNLGELGFAEEAEEFVSATKPQALDPVACLYACDIESAGQTRGFWRLDLEIPIERRQQSPYLGAAERAFGFYAPDDVMAPRFFTGETVWVNPARPAAIGQDALLMSKASPKHEMQVLLCVIDNKSANSFLVRQYGSTRVEELPLASWHAAYVFGRA